MLGNAAILYPTSMHSLKINSILQRYDVVWDISDVSYDEFITLHDMRHFDMIIPKSIYGISRFYSEEPFSELSFRCNDYHIPYRRRRR